MPRFRRKPPGPPVKERPEITVLMEEFERRGIKPMNLDQDERKGCD